MKKNFKKSLAVLLAMLMLLSVVGVSAVAATYTIKFDKGTASGSTAIAGADLSSMTKQTGETIVLPGALFERPNYYQAGWSTGKSGSSKSYDLGANFTKNENRTLYPYWKAVQYTVTYDFGEFGEPYTVDVEYNKNTTLLKVCPIEREGYSVTGWTDGTTEYTLGKSYKVTGDVTMYPIWVKDDYTHTVTNTDANFGQVCVGYARPAAHIVSITNEGNVTFNIALPETSSYEIKLSSGAVSLKPGSTTTFSIQPKANLSAGNYSETLVFATQYSAVKFEVNVIFAVQDHYFNKYESDNNASYTADGTMHAACANNCGFVLTDIPDPGSMKVYSADNNTVIGLQEAYVHHRTVNFTAYGSGYDDEEYVIGKRYVPETWYVNDDFNGEFVDGDFHVTYTHTVFGEYTLSVTYYEEALQYNEATDEYEWVATGETDEKTFEYTVGTNAHEEQEIVLPNTIVGILFGLLTKLLSLFTGLLG